MKSRKSLKILGIAQRGTEAGLTRIRDMAVSDMEFIIVEDFKKTDWANGRLDAYGSFDGILSQCMTHVPEEFRSQSVLFGLGSACRRIMRKRSVRDYMKNHPFKEFWVNNNTISKALSESGFDSKVMYRANQLYFPKTPAPLNRSRIIAWYANSWNGCLKPYKDLSKEVIELLGRKKINVLMFPHDKGWSANHSHVCTLGKTRVPEIMSLASGLVRFGELGDFGRVYYDVLSMGRWVLGYELDEPWTKSVGFQDSPKDIVNYIEELVETDTEEDIYDRWTYAKNHFTDAAMTKNWVNNLKRVFSND